MEENEEFNKLMEYPESEKIAMALLEAVWIMRWQGGEEGKGPYVSVLYPEEADQMIVDIFEELDKAGYKIVKK